MSEERQQRILNAIVEHFIKTAQPVGSKTIIVKYNFDVSPATVRNDMARLEESGLIMHPHTSAGRIPTDKGYRLYVDQLADFEVARALAQETLQTLREQESAQMAKQKVHAAVQLLSKASPNVAFATIPENDRTFFMGFSKLLKAPEFGDPLHASQVMEVIEDRHQFISGLKTLDIDQTPKILIGEENILTGIDSCSLIVTSYNVDGHAGHIGILGPKRMPYAFNASLLTEVRNLLETNQL